MRFVKEYTLAGLWISVKPKGFRFDSLDADAHLVNYNRLRVTYLANGAAYRSRGPASTSSEELKIAIEETPGMIKVMASDFFEARIMKIEFLQ